MTARHALGLLGCSASADVSGSVLAEFFKRSTERKVAGGSQMCNYEIQGKKMWLVEEARLKLLGEHELVCVGKIEFVVASGMIRVEFEQLA